MQRPQFTALLFVCSPLLFLTTLTTSLALAQLAVFDAAPPPRVWIKSDFPGASETEVTDFNYFGYFVGTYVDPGGAAHSFARGPFGGLNTLNAPGAAATTAYGINDGNQIVGWYVDSGGVTHGFVFSPHIRSVQPPVGHPEIEEQVMEEGDHSGGGIFITIDPPGSTLTNARSINNAGTIVGSYADYSGVFHGFTDTAGTFTTFDAPGGALHTEFTGINNRDQKVGIYFDSAGVQHGFTLKGDTFSDVTAPWTGVVVTATERVSDTGEIVGFFGTNAAGPFTGYSRNAAKKFTKESFPGSSETRVLGLVDTYFGTIVGRYTDGRGHIHGFVAH